MASVVVIQRNLPYIKQQFSAALGNSSIVVKCICVTVILCYFLSFSESAVNAISVTPGFIIPPNFWVWTAFTHCFLENRFWLVLADIITVGLCGKLIEPLWGAIEMLTFFAIVNTFVAFLSVTYYIILYTVTSDPNFLFLIHIHGLAGYCAGVAVAVKQIMPEHVLLSTPLGKLRNRNVPLNVLLLSLVLWLVGLLRGTYPVMHTAGLLTSWAYLRFYQYHSNGTRGDMAESFTVASFFPNVLQPPIAVVSNAVFEFLVKIKLCKKPIRKYNMGSSSSSITVNLPGTDPQDAERRRQIALKALSERLSKQDQSAWPSLVDDDRSTETKEDRGKKVTIAMPPTSPHQNSLPQSMSTTSSGNGKPSETIVTTHSTVTPATSNS
ncbi:transmembrane protein 115 [Tachypleus tridentatus]|uniref:transmembrane protein 115 n=1 Tax=Tachypleus tridentatus TaxID=6853 RepID=UPI003FCF9F4F